MCMVRLLKCLKLEKIIQVSFGEYHSKHKYVERVHADSGVATLVHAGAHALSTSDRAPPVQR